MTNAENLLLSLELIALNGGGTVNNCTFCIVRNEFDDTYMIGRSFLARSDRFATVHAVFVFRCNDGCGYSHPPSWFYRGSSILLADEPDTCRYVLQMESHIACDDDFKELYDL